MTDRTDPGGGGLTGATGDLTPDETDQSFVPAERRAIEDPGSQASPEEAGARRDPEPPMPAPHPPAGTPSPRTGGDDVSEGEERF